MRPNVSGWHVALAHPYRYFAVHIDNSHMSRNEVSAITARL